MNFVKESPKIPIFVKVSRINTLFLYEEGTKGTCISCQKIVKKCDFRQINVGIMRNTSIDGDLGDKNYSPNKKSYAVIGDRESVLILCNRFLQEFSND